MIAKKLLFPVSFYFLLKKFFLHLLIIERQREIEHKWGKSRERRRHRIRSRLQALSCQHKARCGAQTHKPWDHDLSRSWTLNWLNQLGAPQLYFLFFNYFLNVYFVFGERETEHERERGRERGRHRIGSRLQALSCLNTTWCGAWTQEPWDHDLNWSQTLNRLSHPGAPSQLYFYIRSVFFKI